MLQRYVEIGAVVVQRDMPSSSSCPNKYLKTSVKANAFKFDVSDASGNLKLFMSVLDKLGVKLAGNQLYEEYQKIYEETVSKNDVHEKEQEKQWNIGRGR